MILVKLFWGNVEELGELDLPPNTKAVHVVPFPACNPDEFNDYVLIVAEVGP